MKGIQKRETNLTNACERARGHQTAALNIKSKTAAISRGSPGGRFKNTYELLNQRALKFSYVNKIHIFQCMGKIFCVEFQRYPLKFHTKYLTHTLKDMIFMQF